MKNSRSNLKKKSSVLKPKRHYGRWIIVLIVLLFGIKKGIQTLSPLFATKENPDVLLKTQNGFYVTENATLIELNRKFDSLPLIYEKFSLTEKKVARLYPAVQLIREISKEYPEIIAQISSISPEDLTLKLKDGKVIIFGLGNFETKTKLAFEEIKDYDTIDLRIVSFLKQGG